MSATINLFFGLAPDMHRPFVARLSDRQFGRSSEGNRGSHDFEGQAILKHMAPCIEGLIVCHCLASCCPIIFEMTYQNYQPGGVS